MENYFHIEGIPGMNGDYPFPESEFNGNELHLIKQKAGVRAGEIGEAFEAGDYDVLLCVAAISMQRAGVTVNMEALWAAPIGRIEVVGKTAEGDAGPLTLTPPAEDSTTSGETGTSGNGLSTSSAPPVNGLSRTGDQTSDRSASAPVTSAT